MKYNLRMYNPLDCHLVVMSTNRLAPVLELWCFQTLQTAVWDVLQLWVILKSFYSLKTPKPVLANIYQFYLSITNAAGNMNV